MDVKQWKHIETLDKDADFDISRLSYLSGYSVYELNRISLDKLKMLLAYYSEPKYRVNKWFVLGFKVFKPIHNIAEFTLAQETDLNNLIKQHNGNYTECVEQLLALTHKELTLKGFKYVQSNHEKNSKLFLKAKAKKVLGNVFFYSKLLKTSKVTINNYLEKLKAHIAEMQADKDFQAFLNNGGLSTM
ncbi:MAG: hypothetical protein KBE91_01505 [Bacteroidia bacterium]|nr:hypothetical protein [Bacteroidia bacterium]